MHSYIHVYERLNFLLQSTISVLCSMVPLSSLQKYKSHLQETLAQTLLTSVHRPERISDLLRLSREGEAARRDCSQI